MSAQDGVVKLHMFESGTLECHLENIKMNQGLGEEYEIPVPWFGIEHPRGLVVIDGGNACAVDPEKHWGAITEVYWRVMKPEQACVPAIKAAGFDPSEVRYLLQSHLHLDHTGALGAIGQFPNAEVIVTSTEYEYAHAPDWFAEGGYIKADYQKPGVPWALLDETDDGCDVFGDGTIRCWRSPGHSLGHQSFEVGLPKSGTFLLTVDYVERFSAGMTSTNRVGIHPRGARMSSASWVPATSSISLTLRRVSLPRAGVES